MEANLGEPDLSAAYVEDPLRLACIVGIYLFNIILIKSGFCGLEHIDTSEHPGLGDTV